MFELLLLIRLTFYDGTPSFNEQKASKTRLLFLSKFLELINLKTMTGFNWDSPQHFSITCLGLSVDHKLDQARPIFVLAP